MKNFNWAPQEPSDLGSYENVLQLMKKFDYKWNDANAEEKVSDLGSGGTVSKYLCECKKVPFS